MLEFFAVALATIMIPTMPFSSITADNGDGMISIGQTAYVQQANETKGKIKTPNGSDVNVTYVNPSEDFTEEEKEFYISYFEKDYENIKGSNVNLSTCNLIDTPTKMYNCLTYAFHKHWGGTIDCKIQEIEPYFSDFSFVQVPYPQPNDIVGYCSDNVLIHAGIVQEVYNTPASNNLGSNLLVRSKWSDYGLYEHRGDLCPFFEDYAPLGFQGAITNNLVYYRRHETHNYEVVKGSDNGTEHTVKCICGDEKTESHKYNRYSILTNGLKSAKHKAECACGASRIERHTLVTHNYGVETYKFCTKCYWSEIDKIVLAKLGIVLD